MLFLRNKGLTTDVSLAVILKFTQLKMSQKLYVGGLPYETTEDDLKNHFSAAGTVTSASVITDRNTGRSRGFGFVEMNTEAEAKSAIDMFNEKDFGGRKLTVNIARPRADEEGGGPRKSFR